MTPRMQSEAVTLGAVDLSMNKSKRKLRLEEFLRQNLDEAPAGNVIQWVDRESGVFRILWTHQSSGSFTQEHAKLFRYWAVARGKSPEQSSVELKQSLRMALNKSPYVKRIPTNHHSSDYRYFCFTRASERCWKNVATRTHNQYAVKMVHMEEPCYIKQQASHSSTDLPETQGEYLNYFTINTTASGCCSHSTLSNTSSFIQYLEPYSRNRSIY